LAQSVSRPAKKLRAGFESRPAVSLTGWEAEAWEIPRPRTTTRTANWRRTRMTVSFREAGTPAASMAAESRFPVQRCLKWRKHLPE